MASAPSSPQQLAVAAFAVAAGDWRRAEDERRRAAVAAVAAGCSYAELAAAAGMSRQAVRQLVLRATS